MSSAGARSSAGRVLHGAGLFLVLAVIVLSPLYYGSVQDAPLWIFGMAMGLLCALAGAAYWTRLARPLPDAGEEPFSTIHPLYRAAGVLLGCFLLLVFLQSIPLGGSLLAGRSRVLAARGLPPEIDLQALSLYPTATRVSLTLLLASAVPLFGALVLFRRRYHLYVVVAVLVATGGMLGLYGLLNYLSANAVSLHHSPETFGGRATGPFVNPNHFATYLGTLLPLACTVLLLKSRSWRRAGEDNPLRHLAALARDVSRRYWKILSALAGLCMALAVVFSRSRMGIVSALCGVAVFLALAFLVRRKGRPVKGWLVSILLLAVFAVAVSAWIGLEPVFERFAGMEPGLTQRLRIWGDALVMTGDFPLLGTGLGTFPHVFPLYQSDGLPGGYSFPHSEFVHLLTETGILGFLLLAGAYGTWALAFLARFRRSAVRTDRIYMAAGAFAGSFTALLNGGTELSLRVPGVLFLFVLLLGTATASLASGARKQQRGPEAPPKEDAVAFGG